MEQQSSTSTDKQFIQLALYPFSIFPAVGFGLGLSGVILLVLIQFPDIPMQLLAVNILAFSLLSGPVVAIITGLNQSRYSGVSSKFLAIFMSNMIAYVILGLLLLIIHYLGAVIVLQEVSRLNLTGYLIPVGSIAIITGIVAVTVGYNHSPQTSAAAGDIFSGSR